MQDPKENADQLYRRYDLEVQAQKQPVTQNYKNFVEDWSASSFPVNSNDSYMQKPKANADQLDRSDDLAGQVQKPSFAPNYADSESRCPPVSPARSHAPYMPTPEEFENQFKLSYASSVRAQGKLVENLRSGGNAPYSMTYQTQVLASNQPFNISSTDGEAGFPEASCTSSSEKTTVVESGFSENASPSRRQKKSTRIPPSK